jgi:hypothetical protein
LTVGVANLRALGAATLSGGGTIVLDFGSIDKAGASSATLVNADNTIRGTGFIGHQDLRFVNEAQGRIVAEDSTLVINSGRGFRNAGLLAAGGVDLSSRGTIILSGQDGGTFDNRSGTISVADSNSRLKLVQGAVIAGGTIFGPTGTPEPTISIPEGEVAALNGVRVFGRTEIDGILRVAERTDGSGFFRVRGGAYVEVDRSATFGFGHNWSMDDGTTIRVLPGGGLASGGIGGELVNEGVISGAGNLGINTLRITNDGSIRADQGTAQTPQVLNVNPSPEGLLNTGVMEAGAFGMLQLTGAGGGSFAQEGGGVIRAADPGSNVHLFDNAQISGGQLGAGAGSISVAFGTITLQDLTSHANLALLGVSTLMINGNVVNNGTIATPFAGRVVVAGNLSLDGGGAGHFASNGSLVVNSGGQLDANMIQGTGTTTVQSGGTLRAHAIRQNRLTIADGASVQLKHATPGTADPSRLGTMTIGAAPAFLDVANRVLILDQSGAAALNMLRAHVVSGYSGGAWDGPGVNSSDAATDPAHGVGYGEANAIFTSFPATYFGQTIDSTTLLLTYTRYGDANLDRVVNLEDFNRLAANFGQNNRLWTQGDFTYDELVNLADFNRLAGNFGLSASGPDVTPQDWAALAAAVPEPGPLLPLLALGLFNHLSGRSRPGGPSCDCEVALPRRRRTCS